MDRLNSMANMAWPDVEARLKAGAVVLLPVGAQEGHAGHLPLATDTIIASGVCQAIAAEIDALITPAIPFGYKSQVRCGGGHHWPGNIGLDGDLLVAILRRVLRDLRDKGATRVAVINGHFENCWFITEACNLATEDANSDDDFRIFSADWWSLVSTDDMLDVFDPPPGDASYEHAALVETSVMLHLAPELVDLEQAPTHEFIEFPPYDLYPPPADRITESGALAPVLNASAEKGEALVQIAAGNLARAIAKELGAAAST